MRLISTALAAALATAAFQPAAAQRQATPEQRIDRLEKQVRQVQRQVFPKGQPADTAGFSDEPAASLTQANQLSARLDAVEQQMAELVRTSEENGNRLATMEAELARLRAEVQRRPAAAEAEPAATEPAEEPVADAAPPPSRPKVETAAPASGSFADPAEAAYDRGFRLWEQKRYDQAIAALKAFPAAHPGHRRVSWANNLHGRALLDKGDARAAATVLLANYRGNPKGERAADSLYYLGQASMKLGQPGQACKAYAELERVYGATMRPQLRNDLPGAKAAANCD